MRYCENSWSLHLKDMQINQRTNAKDRQGQIQSRIYIGASGSMAPGPEVPMGLFESEKKKKIGKLMLSNLKGPLTQTEPIGMRTMLRFTNLGPTTLGALHFWGITLGAGLPFRDPPI